MHFDVIKSIHTLWSEYLSAFFITSIFCETSRFTIVSVGFVSVWDTGTIWDVDDGKIWDTCGIAVCCTGGDGCTVCCTGGDGCAICCTGSDGCAICGTGGDGCTVCCTGNDGCAVCGIETGTNGLPIDTADVSKSWTDILLVCSKFGIYP